MIVGWVVLARVLANSGGYVRLRTLNRPFEKRITKLADQLAKEGCGNTPCELFDDHRLTIWLNCIDRSPGGLNGKRNPWWSRATCRKLRKNAKNYGMWRTNKVKDWTMHRQAQINICKVATDSKREVFRNFCETWCPLFHYTYFKMDRDLPSQSHWNICLW